MPAGWTEVCGDGRRLGTADGEAVAAEAVGASHAGHEGGALVRELVPRAVMQGVLTGYPDTSEVTAEWRPRHGQDDCRTSNQMTR